MAGPAVLQADMVSKLRHDLLERVGVEDTVALLSNVSGKDLLASLGPVVGLDRVRRGLVSREEYLRQYGHRCPHEAEMSLPRPAENPNWIEEQVEGLNSSPVDVDALLAEQRARNEAALNRLRRALSREYASIVKRLDEAARLTRLREMARAEAIRRVWLLREFALHAGRMTGLGNDIFFLEYGEVIGLLKGQDESAAFVPARKGTYEKYRALPLYPTIIMGRFDPFEWAADPNRATDVFDPDRRVRRRIISFTMSLRG
jgi:pyruvate,water dikinase